MRASKQLHLVFAMLAATAPIVTQTPSKWSYNEPRNSGSVFAIARFDPDGSGPSSDHVAVAGPSGRIDVWDPINGAWSAPLPNLNVAVDAMTTTASGELIAAAGTQVWLLTSTSWQPLGQPLLNWTNALAAMPNGDIWAAGQFSVGGGDTYSLARFDGSSWTVHQGLGNGCFCQRVNALIALPSGDLLAGYEEIATGPGPSIGSLRRFDGTTWFHEGDVLINAMTRLANGDVVVGGAFTSAGGVAASNVAVWDGSTWAAMGAGLAASVGSLEAIGGSLVMAAQGQSAPQLWTGISWQAAGPAIGRVDLIAAPTPNDVFAGGPHGTGTPDLAGGGIMRWDSGWTSIDGAFGGAAAVIHDVAERPAGGIAVVGTFTSTPNGPSNNGAAAWDGMMWTALGAGPMSPPGMDDVFAVEQLANGDLIAGGRRYGVPPFPLATVARWNGTSWQSLGDSGVLSVNALAELPNGDLMAGGGSLLGGPSSASLWNGSTWTSIGAGGQVNSLAVLPNGNVIAGGPFAFAGTGGTVARVGRWNGAVWSSITGDPFHGSGARTLLVQNSGDLLAAGQLAATGLQHVVRWDGASWTTLGSSLPDAINALVELPNGYVIAGGNNVLSRWDGTSWTSLDFPLAGSTEALVVLANGNLFVGGGFTTPNGAAVLYATLTTCPAAAAVFGAGCTSGGGANLLVADNLPWTGTVFQATGSQLPTDALIVEITGFAATQLPLQGLVPFGLAGCDLLATHDLLSVGVTTTGNWQSSLAIPRGAGFSGVQLYHQFLPIEIGPGGSIVSMTATNALLLTVGSF